MGVLEEAERSLELAATARATFDVEAMVTYLSAAMRGLGAAGENRRAAMACVGLGDVLVNGMGNLTAGRAWFARAAAIEGVWQVSDEVGFTRAVTFDRGVLDDHSPDVRLLSPGDHPDLL